MTIPDSILIAAAAFTTVALVIAFTWGQQIGFRQAIHQIRRYIESIWPDEYTAYRRGVDEGYQAGLSDAQRHDE